MPSPFWMSHRLYAGFSASCSCSPMIRFSESCQSELFKTYTRCVPLLKPSDGFQLRVDQAWAPNCGGGGVPWPEHPTSQCDLLGFLQRRRTGLLCSFLLQGLCTSCSCWRVSTPALQGAEFSSSRVQSVSSVKRGSAFLSRLLHHCVIIFICFTCVFFISSTSLSPESVKPMSAHIGTWQEASKSLEWNSTEAYMAFFFFLIRMIEVTSLKDCLERLMVWSTAFVKHITEICKAYFFCCILDF